MKIQIRCIKAGILNQIINNELKILQSQCQVLIIFGFFLQSFLPILWDYAFTGDMS